MNKDIYNRDEEGYITIKCKNCFSVLTQNGPMIDGVMFKVNNDDKFNGYFLLAMKTQRTWDDTKDYRYSGINPLKHIVRDYPEFKSWRVSWILFIDSCYKIYAELRSRYLIWKRLKKDKERKKI